MMETLLRKGVENQIYGGITSSGTKSIRSGNKGKSAVKKRERTAENLKYWL
jgi:hypothetical protein